MFEPTDTTPGKGRHQMVTRLQILLLTAELLALDLRNGGRTMEQVQQRSRGLCEALNHVVDAARHLLSTSPVGKSSEVVSSAQAEALSHVRAFVGFIVDHAEHPDVERDVLAEYVDALYEQAGRLIADIDGTASR